MADDGLMVFGCRGHPVLTHGICRELGCAPGEIESFALWPIERVARTVAETREFKDNCNLVIIDFLIRHGLIQPDDPDYVALVSGLRP